MPKKISGWIDVKVRLPKQGEENRVLLYLGNLKLPFEPHIVWGYRESKRWWSQWGELSEDDTPSHWHPIPSPPKSEVKL